MRFGFLRRVRCYAAIAVAICASAADAASSGFSAVLGGAGQEYGSAVTSDAAGNTYVAGLTYSPDFPVTAGAVQTTFGGTCDAFVAKLDPVGKVVWATYLGGILDDAATGIAVDAAGNVWVAGWTRSQNFPVVHPIQSTLNSGADIDAFDAWLAKIDPSGGKLLYSTYLGGPRDDFAYGLALDRTGNVYLTGTVQEAGGFTGLPKAASGFGIFVSKLDPQGAPIYGFFHPRGFAASIAVDAAGSAYVAGTANSALPVNATHAFGPPGSTQALVFKLSADGLQVLYETTLGGSGSASGLAIAVDRGGSAYVGGTTTSYDFPLMNALQSSVGARPLWKSTDAGSTWTPIDDLPFAFPQAMAADPTAPDTVYAATADAGMVKSTDGGAKWTQINHGIAGTRLDVVAIDPRHTQTLYAGRSATPGVLYKSTDAGSNWTAIESFANESLAQLAVDAQNPSIVYSVWGAHTDKSTDGGATWSAVKFPGNGIVSVALDPAASENLYAISAPFFGGPHGPSTPSFIYHSTDGGVTWVQLASPPPILGLPMLMDANTSPSIVYDALAARSTDGGVTWTSLAPSPVTGSNTTAIAIDSGGVLYGSVYNNGIFVSRDHGQTWTQIGSPMPSSNLYGAGVSVLRIVPTSRSSILYTLLNNPQNAGFLTKLSADGGTLAFSTFLRGHVSFGPVVEYAAEPGQMVGQNEITAVALDGIGNVVAAGIARGTDFPVANGAQKTNGGRGDAFVTAIAGDGSRILYSSYLGGSQDDGALALAIDPQGSPVVVGQTWSFDFPVPGGVQPPAGQLGDVFVSKVAAPAPPVITAVLNGASFQPGIEAGSWVTIMGSNLANTNPGRKWNDNEVVDGKLPASLDGVSVTIDGKPAFVYYISPTQINVQAPSDATIGPVAVVVDNNGWSSAPATAQLQSASPAFFTFPGTSTAIATRLPDYGMTIHAGDTVVLWGTGFGATDPPVSAGFAVQGAPAVAATPTVTIGGTAVAVISAVMTTGTAGLYQVTVQLPANLPPGPATVQASVAGVHTAAGVTITVAGQ